MAAAAEGVTEKGVKKSIVHRADKRLVVLKVLKAADVFLGGAGKEVGNECWGLPPVP